MIEKEFIEKDYPNFLDNITSTYSELIEIFKENEYVQPKRYDEKTCTKEERFIEVDFDIHMPLFSKCMDKFIVEKHTLPTQEEFKDYYFLLNGDYFAKNNMATDAFNEAITIRCYRAYPSLIRDVLFGKYLQEVLPSDYKVINNSVLDQKAEIDLMIVGKNKNWGIHLFTNTSRSKNYRICKNDRKQLYFTNVTHIDLPINFNYCETINGLKIYGKKEYQRLTEICDELSKNNYIFNVLNLKEMESYYKTYINYLTKLIGEEAVNNLVDTIGGDNIMRASYATTTDTNLAYEGSYTTTILQMAEYAKKVNELLPENMRADNKSIYKVCLLSQIAKAIMFVPNTDSWQVTKQGKAYTFANLPGALRVGERSILLAMNAGVKFTEEEFEAMRILDKTKEEDNYSRYYSCALTTVIKQAIEIMNLVSKNGNNVQ